MSHQLEISFEYDDEPAKVSARPKLDLLDGLTTVKDLAHRNLNERNSSLSSRLNRKLDTKYPNNHRDTQPEG